jgi:hypothetical protein
MVSVQYPKYRFKQDFTAKLCNNFIESFTTKTPCKSYRDLVFKKGDVFESTVNVNNTDPNKIFGLASMTPFEVPLRILDKVDSSIEITDVVKGDTKANQIKKEAVIATEEKNNKMMFIIPTIVILAVVWIYGIKKL